MTFRIPLLLAALAACALPAAVRAQPIVQQPQQLQQPQVGVPATLQVQRLAPQLVAFAGSQANFNSLVNGLSLGSPITLETTGADGTRQLVTFSPTTAPMSPVEIARTLEAARQQLISSGIATPNAQQLGVALTGTEVPLTPQTAQVPAQPDTQAVSPARELQSRIGSGAAAGTTAPTRQPIVPRGNTSDSRVLGSTSNTPRLAPNPVVPAQPAAPPRVLEAPPASPRPNADR